MRRLVLALFLVRCRTPTLGDALADAQASPQANAVPAPLATEPQTQATTAGASVDAGPPPSAMRSDEALERDALPVAVKDTQAATYTMTLALRPLDPPTPPKGAEIGAATIDAARKRLDPRLTVDFSPSRMRMQLTSGAWLLGEGWELRARSDRYGHLLLSPDQMSYRVLAPGALRALLGERRLDVAPVATAEVTSKGDGMRRLGMKTRRVEVSSRSAKATFELAKVEGTGDAGPMVARALLDLMSAPPSTVLAQADEIPMHAELRWTTRGGLVVEALSLVKRADLALGQLSVPPTQASFSTDPLPRQAAALFLEPGELGGIHVAAVEVGPQPLPVGDAHGTLTLGNATDELRVAWVDGVPAAWVAPRARVDLAGLWRGRYQLEWRTYLGDAAEPPASATAPGFSEVGATDAGVK